MNIQQYYTTQEAATFLGLSYHALRWHIHERNLSPIPHNQLPDEVRKYHREQDNLFARGELERFAREKRKVGRPAKTPSQTP